MTGQHLLQEGATVRGCVGVCSSQGLNNGTGDIPSLAKDVICVAVAVAPPDCRLKEDVKQRNTYLPQLQQLVGSDLPLWKNSQTDCASGGSSSVSVRRPFGGTGTGKGSRVWG